MSTSLDKLREPAKSVSPSEAKSPTQTITSKPELDKSSFQSRCCSFFTNTRGRCDALSLLDHAPMTTEVLISKSL